MRDYPLDFFLAPMKPSKPPKTMSGTKRLDEMFNSGHVVAEEKVDGCRYFSIGGRIFSPRISDVDGIPVEKTEQVRHISEVLKLFGGKLILDGEICYPGKKSQDVIMITGSAPDVAYAKQKDIGWLHYAVFDVLRDVNGQWLTERPWYERRAYLEELKETKLLTDITSKYAHFVHLVPVVVDDKRAYLEELLGKGKEGVVLKNVKASYQIGKRPAWQWVKCKVENEDDVVIMGFEPPERIYTGKHPESWPYWAKGETIIEGHCPGPEWVPVTKYYARGWVGSIIFGKYSSNGSNSSNSSDGNLVRLGTCAGMDEVTRAKFSRCPERYIGKVMKVKLMELTRDFAYRHCRFDGLHSDKNPSECVLTV